MNSNLLREIAIICQRDADAISDHYAWPPKILTEEERREALRLDILSRRLYYRALTEEG